MPSHPRRGMVRSRTLLLTLVAFVALIGSSLVSLLQDTITSPGNQFDSGTYQPPSSVAHDLQVAVPGTGVTCDDSSLVWTEGPVAAAYDALTADLQDAGTTHHTSTRLCLRNNTDAQGVLMAGVANLSDTELGACGSTESTVDTTCTDGGVGELAPVLFVTLEMWAGGGYTPVSNPLSTWTSGPLVADQYALAGDVWEVRFAYHVSLNSTTDQRLAAQTDRVTFDLFFTLQDTA